MKVIKEGYTYECHSTMDFINGTDLNKQTIKFFEIDGRYSHDDSRRLGQDGTSPRDLLCILIDKFEFNENKYGTDFCVTKKLKEALKIIDDEK